MHGKISGNNFIQAARDLGDYLCLLRNAGLTTDVVDSASSLNKAINHIESKRRLCSYLEWHIIPEYSSKDFELLEDLYIHNQN